MNNNNHTNNDEKKKNPEFISQNEIRFTQLLNADTNLEEKENINEKKKL